MSVASTASTTLPYSPPQGTRRDHTDITQRARNDHAKATRRPLVKIKCVGEHISDEDVSVFTLEGFCSMRCVETSFLAEVFMR